MIAGLPHDLERRLAAALAQDWTTADPEPLRLELLRIGAALEAHAADANDRLGVVLALHVPSGEPS